MTKTKQIPAEYTRKMAVAADMATSAYIKGGLDGMREELRSLLRIDACPLIISEFERLYHRQCLRVLPEAMLSA